MLLRATILCVSSYLVGKLVIDLLLVIIEHFR